VIPPDAYRPAPGWYRHGGVLRWHTGYRWTEGTRPLPGDPLPRKRFTVQRLAVLAAVIVLMLAIMAVVARHAAGGSVMPSCRVMPSCQASQPKPSQVGRVRPVRELGQIEPERLAQQRQVIGGHLATSGLEVTDGRAGPAETLGEVALGPPASGTLASHICGDPVTEGGHAVHGVAGCGTLHLNAG
jgi:hypothetical protein